jgi:hypothetical protein
MRTRPLSATLATQAAALILSAVLAPAAHAYAFNYIVPDMRLPVAQSGGSACPVPFRMLTATAAINRRWSTALSGAPVTIVTTDQTPAGRLNEIETAVLESFAVWTGVSGTTLQPASLAALSRTSTQDACRFDGANSLCFDQSDGAFTPGVLAFTRVVAADHLGAQIGSSPGATQLGQILDADVYFNPGDSRTVFATPSALPANPSAYDFESVLIHELGHFFGFSHSAVWRAMMYPFAPAPGTFTGTRPNAQQPDAPLADDDRTGLRVLYPDTADTAHAGTISGRILPANPLSLPLSPSGVTGIYGAQVVALDAVTGSVVAALLSDWSCSGSGPAQFDGSYRLERLRVGASYKLYAEPLTGPASPSTVSNATATVCRNSSTDAGWPAPFACVVPAVTTNFTARIRGTP